MTNLQKLEILPASLYDRDLKGNIKLYVEVST